MQNKTLLHILLVITFIWAGMCAMSYFSIGMMLPQMKQIVADNPGVMPEQFSIMMERMFEAPRGFYLASALLYLFEVLGAVLMWRLRWPGFHCYTLARLLLLLLPALFLGRGFIGLGDVMMAILYVGMYYLLMRRLTSEKGNPPTDELTASE